MVTMYLLPDSIDCYFKVRLSWAADSSFLAGFPQVFCIHLAVS